MTSAKTLSSVNIGGKPVRFLYYRAPCVILTAHTPELKCTDLPLFLAADVLAGSNQAVKNHARIHARYAKDGLASRLTFRNMKIEGIHNSSVVWFYNTQGLFKVIFEHLDTAAQRDCLYQLKDLWLERCTDPTLAESIDVQHLHGICEDHTETVTENISIQDTVAEMTVQTLDSVVLTQNSGDIRAFTYNQDGDTASLPKQERLPKTLEVAHQCCVGTSPNGTQTSDNTTVSPLNRTDVNSHFQTSSGDNNSEVHAADLCSSNNQDFGCAQCSNVSPQNSSLCHVAICTSMNRTPDSANFVTRSENICQQCPFCWHSHVFEQRSQTSSDSELAFLVHNILELLQSRVATMLDSEQELLQKLVVLIEFFKHEFLMTDPSGESAAFPYTVLEQYTLLIKNQGVQKLFGNKFDIPCRRNAVLCLLSEWLGVQLCSLSDALHSKVEEFKQKNINCIENLPCPRTLVDLVFPRCMQILLVHWLGQHEEEETEMEGQYGAADHSYSAVAVKQPNIAVPTATPSTSTPDKFPFIQFILEFANNALISGVAHVVYSRLVNSC